MLKDNDIFRDKLNVSTWHDKGFTGKGINIVVLDDNGLIREHSKDRVTEPFNDSSKVNHKTNVVDVILEFAPDVKIFAFNWFADNKVAIAKWIEENKEKIDLINCSFISIYANEFEPLTKLNIPILCGSGNLGKDYIQFPASHDKTISVGAITHARNRKLDIANWSKDLDTASFCNAYVQGTNNMFTFGGTSCATAVLSGTVALLLQYYQEKGIKLSAEQLRSLIHKYSNLEVIHEENRNQVGRGLFVLLDIDDLREDDFMSEEIFKDVKETDWFHKAVKWAKDKGILKGYPDGTFKPNQPLTRAEYAQAEYNKEHKEDK